MIGRARILCRTMVCLSYDLVSLLSSTMRSRAQLAAENLFLRKQLALYLERQAKPRRADDATRITLVALSRFVDWRRLLTVVKPETLIRWHRKGFRLFWRWKSRAKQGTQAWSTFVRNHARSVLASDFFVVVTATFRVIYVFVVLDVGTRRILHWNATAHPTDWTAQQFRMIVPDNQTHAKWSSIGSPSTRANGSIVSYA